MSNERVIYPSLLEHTKLRQALTAGEQEIYIQPHLKGLVSEIANQKDD